MTEKVQVNFAELDFRDVKFASDRLTIEGLRKADWGMFDDGFHIGERQQPQFFFNGGHGRHAADVLGNMLFCERAVVATAFADHAGADRPDCEIDGCKETLIQLYQKCGLAKGEQEAKMLIRELEKAGHEMGRTGGPWNYQPGHGRSGR
jgi:hypothetical protein